MKRIHILYHNTRDGVVPQWNFIPTPEQMPYWQSYPQDIFDMDLVEEMPNSGLVYSRLDQVPNGEPWIYELRNYYDRGMYQVKSGMILEHFLSEPRLMSDLLAGHGYILYNDRREGQLDPFYLNSMLNVWSRHGIPSNRVIFATGASNAEELLRKRGGGMRSLYIRQFELVSRNDLVSFDHSTSTPEKIEKRFICFNRRLQDREHRMQLLSLIRQRDLLPQFYYSFGSEPTDPHIPDIAKGLEEPRSWKTYETMCQMLPEFPMELDTDQWQVNLAFRHKPDQVGRLYARSGISVVTETLFYRDEIFFSEKSWHPMRFMHPFIMVNTPGSLACLRQLGYETWSDWWDEGYDEIGDHHARMEAIVDLISEIAAWPQNKWDAFMAESRDRCLRNRDKLMRFSQEISYVDQLEKLWPR